MVVDPSEVLWVTLAPMPSAVAVTVGSELSELTV